MAYTTKIDGPFTVFEKFNNNNNKQGNNNNGWLQTIFPNNQTGISSNKNNKKD